MERTINEIYELIKQKRENAFNHRERVCMPLGKETTINDLALKFKLEGTVDAYTDVIALIESSGLVNQDKTKS